MSEKNDKIPLQLAKTWTEEWRHHESDYNYYNECNAFLIPISDLKQVLKEMEHQDDDSAYVRGYLGVEKLDSGKGRKFVEKLIIVGTKLDDSGIYRDLIKGYTVKGDPEDVTENGGGGIWDFTVPCPPQCDPNSPLN